MKRNSTSSQGNTALNVVLCLIVVGVVAAVVAGSFVRRHDKPRLDGALACQGNLKQIGIAIKQYLNDWDFVFPTNKPANAPAPEMEVQLADPSSTDATGKPMGFAVANGVRQRSWVGALYPYIEAVTAPDDKSSVWKCPEASSEQYGSTDAVKKSAAVTYVINFNLLERPEKDIRYGSTLMLCRETDRLVASACRGGKLTGATMTVVKGPDDAPASPFLCTTDLTMPGVNNINNRLHGDGSNVLFADGHVKWCLKTWMSDECVWDPKSRTCGDDQGIITVTP